MAKSVTINLFDVSRAEKTQKLSRTLEEFSLLPLEKRTRSEIRLDRVEFQPADVVLPVDAWHLDFAKARDIGPGKMAKDKYIADIGLGEGELFGEETAAIYVPKKKWLLVLNNHYGVGPSRMASYFNALDTGITGRQLMYSIDPKIDQTALDRMEAMKSFAEVEITASVGAFDDGGDVGESVLQAASGIKAHRVHLRFIANEKHKRGDALSLSAVKDMVTRLLRKDTGVDKLKVKGAEQLADKQDKFIDLIEHKIRRQYSTRDLVVVNLRYTYESKIHLLRKACLGWLNTIG